MDAIIMSVGDELLLGQTVDTNTAWLSRQMAARGAKVKLHLTAADELEPLTREIDQACQHADVVLISGGLGPTEDDLTRQALARAMGVELRLDSNSVEQIRRFFRSRGREMPEANAIQAMIPVGGAAIENTCGTAPGLRATHRDTEVFVMPGVPREMRVMFERDVAPWVRERAGGATTLSRVLQCIGAGESDIGAQIRDLMQRGANPTVGTTAKQGIIGIRVNAHGASPDQAQQLLEQTTTEIRQRVGDLIFGQDEQTLAEAVAALLVQHEKTISTAESCTGGLIAKCLTDVAGSSAYMIQGVVSYSNEAKMRLLQVPSDLIEQHGAVSPQVAESMAVNCARLSGTDLAISVTGIAGPTGGTPAKPVGLVYIGLASDRGCEVVERRLGESLTREEIRDRTCKHALNMVRRQLLAWS
jgi:nicotinamide-nucleotide amidase